MKLSDDFKHILIIGMAGGLAKLVTKQLLNIDSNVKITGVDPRVIPHQFNSKNIILKRIPYTRSKFEKLFRENNFDAVFHLGRMSHAGSNPKAKLIKRLNLNLMGTRRIMDLSLKFGAKKIVILSTFHTYGALPDNPVYISEDSPLKASMKYPELLDIVEMDQIATNWMWKNSSRINVTVLRPCNIIGEEISNSICKYLTTPLMPSPIDFNPMMQFIHEFDMAAVIAETLTRIPAGIFNVTTTDVISLKNAKKIVGIKTIPIPLSLLSPITYLLNKTIFNIPSYLIDYLKFPCIIDNHELLKYLDPSFFRFNSKQALELLKK
jgi:UDP-glucose 4-epimerase